jgi:hypothetical protein
LVLIPNHKRIFKMKTLITAIVLVICFVGCETKNYDDPSILALNRERLSGRPEVVGKLPNGKAVYRYRIDMGSNMHDHWLYVVEDADTVTNNRIVEESDGEDTTTFNEVDVVITKKKTQK